MKRDVSKISSVFAFAVLGAVLAGCSGGSDDCSASRSCDPSQGAGAAGTGGMAKGDGGASGAAAGNGGSTPGEAGAGGSSGSGSAGAGAGGSDAMGGTAGSEDPGAAGSGPDPEPPDVTAPVIQSISPADGSSGVRADVPIVVTFSEPMDRAVAEAAVVAPEFTGLSFGWDDTGTVLTIGHDALDYASGSDPAAVTARSYAVTISRGATDLAGNRLADAAGTTFSTLRRLRWVSAPALDEFNRDLTALTSAGSVVGCPAHNELVVGELQGSTYMKLFTSFDLAALPPGIAEFERATLTTGELIGVTGAPYGDQSLGVLVSERVQYTSLGVSAMNMPGLGQARLLADATRVTGRLTTDIGADVAAAYAEGASKLQLRIGFTKAISPNGQSDAVRMFCRTPFGLDASYLVP